MFISLVFCAVCPSTDHAAKGDLNVCAIHLNISFNDSAAKRTSICCRLTFFPILPSLSAKHISIFCFSSLCPWVLVICVSHYLIVLSHTSTSSSQRLPVGSHFLPVYHLQLLTCRGHSFIVCPLACVTYWLPQPCPAISHHSLPSMPPPVCRDENSNLITAAKGSLHDNLIKCCCACTVLVSQYSISADVFA